MKELEQPLISIIVPVYKVEKYLKRCVDSILTQTYQNMEIILVDDGSPDNCGAICDRYKETDNRVVVIHKKNGGLSDARNTAIPLAKGEYISFIDIGFALNCGCYAVIHVKEAFAVGTLLSAIVWFFISKTDFKYLKCSKKTELYLFVQLILLLTFGFMLPSVIGCIAYVVATIVSLGILMNGTLRDLMEIGIKMINKRRK